MPGDHWKKSGWEWQELIIRILKAKYPPGEFVEVPDRVGGDCGVEGFGRDGMAYQCYACEGPLDLRQLTISQKRKMTEDIAKLRKNASALSGIFGTTKISRWIFVVPYWDDKSLVVHANKKASELLKDGLPFIDGSFQIAICTQDDYETETTLLALNRTPCIDIEPAELSPTAVDEWMKSSGDDYRGNLSNKCRVLQPDPKLALQMQVAFIRKLLQGQNALEKLRSRTPDLYQEAVRLKRKTEEFLDAESLMADAQPPEKLRTTLDEFQRNLRERLPGVDQATLKHVGFEAVVDWLVRCPLNFPEETRS